MGKIGQGCRPHLKRSHFYPGGKDDNGLGDSDVLGDDDGLGDCDVLGDDDGLGDGDGPGDGDDLGDDGECECKKKPKQYRPQFMN